MPVHPDEIERRLDDATMHMHNGWLGRAISEARIAIDLMEQLDSERHEYSLTPPSNQERSPDA